MRKRCQAPRPGSSGKSVMEHGISRFGTGGPALGLLNHKTSLWWAGAFWLCRRNASAHMWLYVFGLSRVHHPKSLCKLLRSRSPWGRGTGGGVLVRPRAANTICDLDGSRPNSSIQFGSFGHLSSADSSRFRFLPPPTLASSQGLNYPMLFFSKVNRGSVSLNIKAFVSPQRVAEASCG